MDEKVLKELLQQMKSGYMRSNNEEWFELAERAMLRIIKLNEKNNQIWTNDGEL